MGSVSGLNKNKVTLVRSAPLILQIELEITQCLTQILFSSQSKEQTSTFNRCDVSRQVRKFWRRLAESSTDQYHPNISRIFHLLHNKSMSE